MVSSESFLGPHVAKKIHVPYFKREVNIFKIAMYKVLWQAISNLLFSLYRFITQNVMCMYRLIFQNSMTVSGAKSWGSARGWPEVLPLGTEATTVMGNKLSTCSCGPLIRKAYRYEDSPWQNCKRRDGHLLRYLH